jgi:hypothetical protein
MCEKSLSRHRHGREVRVNVLGAAETPEAQGESEDGA